MFKFQPTRFGEYRVSQVTYCRNGVSGVGFMTGIFTVSGDNYLFTLFSDDDGEFINIPTNVKCAIMNITNIHEGIGIEDDKYRGDYYYDRIVNAAIKEYQAQEKAYWENPS